VKKTFTKKMGRTVVGSSGGGGALKSTATISRKPVEETIREIKSGLIEQKDSYRERSLAIHGHVCAKCGREFEAKQRHLLTVHHKDGDHSNNPPDGSNWENLCLYCHEAEHSREMLGGYLAVKRSSQSSKEERMVLRDAVGMDESAFAAKLKAALKKGHTSP